MEGVVTFYDDQLEWFHAYDNDAVVISKIKGFTLYERFSKGIKKKAIGFPKEMIRSVIEDLKIYNIGYRYDGYDIVIEYPNSKYKEVLENIWIDNYSPTARKIKKYIMTGAFTIQYNDEEPISKEIGVNIDPKAEIIQFVAENEAGKSYKYGDDVVTIISKNIKLKETEVSFSIDEFVGKH